MIVKENFALKTLYYKFGGYVLNLEKKILLLNGETISLNPKLYECLVLLVENAGKVVSKDEFKNTVWKGKFIEDRILAVNISSLRKILGADKDGTSCIQNISGRGYKFLFDVERFTLEDEKVSQADEQKTFQTSEKTVSKASAVIQHQRFYNSKGLIISVFFTLISFAAGAYFFYGRKNEEKTVTPKKIAVFPFENIAHIQETDYLSLAFADSINNSLTAIPNLSVTSTTEVKQYLNRSYEPVEEGKKLGVGVVVTGSYRRLADKLLVDVVITDVSVPNPVIQQAEFVKTTNDLTNLQTNVVKFITNNLNINVSEKDLTVLKNQESQNLEAFEYYLRGVNAHTNGKFDDAVFYYKKSLELDSQFDIANESLANVYMAQGSYSGCGKPCADKAVEILNNLNKKDPDNDRVSINLAQSLVELNQAEKGIPMLKKIVEKNPKNYFAYNILSYAYRYVGLLDSSNYAYDKANGEDQDVLTDKTYWFYNNSRLYQGKCVEFIGTLDKVAETDISMLYRGMAYFYLKDYEKAKVSFTQAYSREQNAMLIKFSKVYIYYIDNDKTNGLKFLDGIYKSMKENKVYVGEIIYHAAQAYALYGQKEKALELFDLSVEKGFFPYTYFVNDPLLENVRKEPGFQQTLEKARKRYESFKQTQVN